MIEIRQGSNAFVREDSQIVLVGDGLGIPRGIEGGDTGDRIQKLIDSHRDDLKSGHGHEQEEDQIGDQRRAADGDHSGLDRSQARGWCERTGQDVERRHQGGQAQPRRQRIRREQPEWIRDEAQQQKKDTHVIDVGQQQHDAHERHEGRDDQPHDSVYEGDGQSTEGKRREKSTEQNQNDASAPIQIDQTDQKRDEDTESRLDREERRRRIESLLHVREDRRGDVLQTRSSLTEAFDQSRVDPLESVVHLVSEIATSVEDGDLFEIERVPIALHPVTGGGLQPIHGLTCGVKGHRCSALVDRRTEFERGRLDASMKITSFG